MTDLEDWVERGDIDLLSATSYRVNFKGERSSGSQTYFLISASVSLTLLDATPSRPYHSRFLADEPLLLLRASLSSDSSYTIPGLPMFVCNRPEIVLIYVPRGAEIHIESGAGARQLGLIALLNAERFLQSFGLDSSAVPESLRGMVDGTSHVGHKLTVPLDARLAVLIESMVDVLPNKLLQQALAWAKLQEFVILMLDAIGRNPASCGPHGLRPRDLALALSARDLLKVNYTAPPPFAEMARGLGTNLNKLKVAFREVFGTTMANYCKERRVREAQVLLLEGRLSIGQVAERVGYEHQSSFTAAFRKEAGMSPRDYQKHRAALDVTCERRALLA